MPLACKQTAPKSAFSKVSLASARARTAACLGLGRRVVRGVTQQGVQPAYIAADSGTGRSEGATVCDWMVRVVPRGSLTWVDVVEGVGPIHPLIDVGAHHRVGSGTQVEPGVALGSQVPADDVALEDAALGGLQDGDLRPGAKKGGVSLTRRGIGYVSAGRSAGVYRAVERRWADARACSGRWLEGERAKRQMRPPGSIIDHSSPYNTHLSIGVHRKVLGSLVRDAHGEALGDLNIDTSKLGDQPALEQAGAPAIQSELGHLQVDHRGVEIDAVCNQKSVGGATGADL